MTKPSRTQTEQNTRVWQPKGFAGVEVGIKRRAPVISFPTQVMQTYDIVLNGVGQGEVRYSGSHYSFDDTDGLVFIQQPGETYFGEFTGEVGASGACLSLSPETMRDLQRTLGVAETPHFPDLLPPEAVNEPLARLTGETLQAFEEPANHVEREAKLLGLVFALLKYASNTPPPERKLGQEHRAAVLVREVLHAHPGANPTLDELTALTGLGKRYLMGVFKRDVGVSVHAYMQAVSVQEAKRRLIRGEEISQTAYELGFYDQAHFTKVFKRFTNVTPGQFRRDTLNAT